MNSKLTLTVQKNVIERAKSYAKESGKSLSEIVENYLADITKETGKADQISPRVKKIAGSVKLPKDFDEKEEIGKYLQHKHL